MPLDDVAIFDELEPESADFTPQVKGWAKVTELAVGQYDFTICDVNTRRYDDTPVVDIKLRVGDGKTGMAYDWSFFLGNDADKEKLAGTLEHLGFKFARPFGGWLRTTLPKLVGVRFKGERKDREYEDSFTREKKIAHDLRIMTRLAAPTNGTPAPAAAPSAPQRRATAGAGGPGADIPF